jgi:hypothetical protein
MPTSCCARQEIVAVSTVEIIRHRAAICGYVRDAKSGAGLAGASVDIAARGVTAEAGADGFYYFLDLPDGSYTLHAAVPALGTRYTDVTVAGVTVAKDASGAPALDPRGDLALPPTRLTGQVKAAGSLAPVARAEVRLRVAAVSTLSDAAGKYALSAIEAGEQTVQVSASGFAAFSQRVTLQPGQEVVSDFTLTAG